ncbi:MAG: AIPR family protein [Marinifilaceae bacterium]
MIIEEYLNYRKELLDQSMDDQEQLSETLLLSQVLPSMVEARLIDSEDFNQSYFKSVPDKLKINAYCVNESGERLQLFLVNENSIDLTAKSADLQISTKLAYESQFKRGTNFIIKAIKGHLNEETQDSHPARALISQVSSSAGADQFDVIEVFLISTTATVSLQGAKPQPKRIEFENEEFAISYTKKREKRKKKILIKKRLIDLNFLYNIIISQGNREALKVDFNSMFGYPIQAIKAADELNFESYLCALPASLISGLYKEHSTRLLEKNVRSFLQFRGVNKGIRETIRKEPEKFVAYNNGLTITATSGEICEQNGQYTIKSLTDFQIVNGGQTTATIYFTQKDGFDINKVKVMAKINVAKEATNDQLEELISNISTYSNAQSRVSKVDLRSRNPQLVKIKSLSESVVTPSGMKWFFERAKGEFNTKLRIAGNNKTRYKKEYPNERRFSKEQLAKYYCSWGEQPHMIKKGGEKVFRYFIEELCGEGSFKKPVEVNRGFFEELIAKIIIFRRLEKIYGQGKNSMGQLRSAAVPYSISTLYKYTDGNRSGSQFNLLKIWMEEGLDHDLEAFFTDLLRLMNNLIKKYSLSEDYGEYSKKQELWDTIIKSKEIQDFIESTEIQTLLNKYTIPKTDLKKRKGKNKKLETDFTSIKQMVEIFDRGDKYYSSIIRQLSTVLSDMELRKLNKIKGAIQNLENLELTDLNFEEQLLTKLRGEHPEMFDRIGSNNTLNLKEPLDYIIEKYNKCISSQQDIKSEFDKVADICTIKNIRYGSIFREIGKQLEKGLPPTIEQIHYASNYIIK